MSWRDQAACLGMDTELFFPIGTGDPAPLQASEAKQVCAACPVRLACLACAVALGMDHGIWGGLSEDDRRAQQRRRARQQAQRPVGPVVVRQQATG